VGNSTIRLQDVMDSIAAIGDIQTVFDHTGGWSDQPAITIANDVVKELMSVRFPWKWNRINVPAFPLTSLQQDYASIRLRGLGWLENGLRVDVNNTFYPPPTWVIYAVRDLQMTSVQSGFPYQVCWFYNRDLEYSRWPGPYESYTWPIGVAIFPQNPPTNIRTRAGHILVLTTYGVTGDVEPEVPPWENPDIPKPKDYPTGVQVTDGSCVWTVADPDAQGFRFNPIPPSAGNVWLIRLWGQRKAPHFRSLQQFIDPIPDDEEKWFRDGCIAYAHRYAANPAVKARYAQVKAEWIAAMEMETKKNDREDEAKGFFPDKSIMSPSYTTDPGPYPYRYGWR
jgi:hypothetical protein